MNDHEQLSQAKELLEGCLSAFKQDMDSRFEDKIRAFLHPQPQNIAEVDVPHLLDRVNALSGRMEGFEKRQKELYTNIADLWSVVESVQSDLTRYNTLLNHIEASHGCVKWEPQHEGKGLILGNEALGNVVEEEAEHLERIASTRESLGK